jgi:hypothetical protein
VLQRQNFKSSEKAPPLQKPQEWGTQRPNQFQRPNFQINFKDNFQINFKDPTSKTTETKTTKENGVNNFYLSRLLR